ncbi:Starch-binding associating with outer membrane [Parapedobacter indicus]|uniref:Starch-binding associating with outer membrane n=2 Tax=Parapedobacter indicus TaxID=1477437 RepID=A0A1I3DKK1_9SPHI|nr:putative outer membrane starch-binding protein [Parapedobacter indicus]SFH87203.1 Starch-binding associating with outer membrane [Parapedobacter indicus]
MKKTIFYTFFTICLLSSCGKEFLKLSPQTTVTSGSFFETESHFDLALVGVYTQLRGIVSAGHYMDEMRSDNSFFRYYAPDRGPANWVEDIIQWTDQSQTTVVNNRYYSDYQGISRANAILNRLDNSSLTDEAKTRISAETLFLRAFYYFDLVTHYGGVPLYLNEVVDEASAYQARASVEEVYQQIVADLEKAIPLLPVVSAFPQSGRATRGAAKMLLAKSFMSMPLRDYAKAEIELRDVTNMNYGLLDRYLDNFNPATKNNKESIFEIQYMEGDDGQQSDFIYSMLPKTANTAVATGISVNNVVAGGWNVPNQGLIDSYESGDERLPASVKIMEGTLNGGSLSTDPVTYIAIKDIGGYSPQSGNVYFPFVAKYLHGPYSKPFNTGQNWPVFRYADALLLMAECLVAQGKGDEALPFLNAVRKRAGLSDLSVATVDNVLLERRHELAFENHRWTDLIRNGKAIEVMSAYGAEMKQRYDFLPEASFNVTEERLIYAIPFRETQINPQLVQNSGY